MPNSFSTLLSNRLQSALNRVEAMQDTSKEQHTLPAPLHKAILRQCNQGYQLYDQGSFKQALLIFYTAWTSIPKPQAKWQESSWVLTALGDTYLKKQDYDAACEALRSALRCHLASDNPVIHLKLAQGYLESRQSKHAKTHFLKALEYGGINIIKTLPVKQKAYVESLIQQIENNNNG